MTDEGTIIVMYLFMHTMKAENIEDGAPIPELKEIFLFDFLS